jgi:hypothetical protein
MDYLAIEDRRIGGRWSAAQQREQELLSEGYDTAFHAEMTLVERVKKLADNFQRGYFVVPSELFSHPDFGRKHGPTKDFLRRNDLRALRTEMFRKLPVTERTYVGEIPSQVMGVKFSTPRGASYVFRLTDLVSARAAFKSLQDSFLLEEYDKEEGRLVVSYDASQRDSSREERVDVRLLGFGRTVLSAHVNGIPSYTYRRLQTLGAPRRNLERLQKYYAPKFPRLQVVPKGSEIREGEFVATPAVPQWDAYKRTAWKDWNSHIVPATPAEKEKTLHLYRPDLLAILLIDNAARRFGYDVNHPLFRFGEETIGVLRGFYEFGVLTEEGRRRVPRRSAPSYEQAEQLFNLYLAGTREKRQAAVKK